MSLLALTGCAPALPAPIAAEAARTGPGKVTIVEFIDFQCPFCRRNHEMLMSLVSLRREKVHIVRKHVPLRRHSHAFSAAVAAVCAEAQGRGDEMAELLVSAAVPHLRADGCEEMAVELGLDIARFRTCVTDPATTSRVHADAALFDSIGGRGVPLVFVGSRRLMGLQDEATLEAAITEALEDVR